MTKEEVKARARQVLKRLAKLYPDAKCALDHGTAFELLCATILSAQCTDARVNLVTPELFRRWPDAHALAGARQGDVESVIRSTGFFRNKAKNLIAMAQALVAEHGGEVPDTMEALHALPGVGRKTANVLLGNWFGKNEGVTVDTHVTRLSRLLKLTRHTDAVKIERDLMALIPRASWTVISHYMILHGRAVCIANRPKCGVCVLAGVCPSSKVRSPESEVRGSRARRSSR
ncbi:MAG TPA: endonuclease III [Gemmatimonadales bacterium]|nr:endonuclease III [Gemmatimonadales bacterium]